MTTDVNILAIPPSDPAKRAAWVRATIPQQPTQRSAWVKAQLQLRGKSFADIGREAGVSRNAVAQTMRVASSRLERAIAEALGLEVQELFADRFGPDGKRLHAVRGATSDDNPDAHGRNAKDREAA